MKTFLNIIKSRFFIITLIVAFLLSIVPGVLCIMGQGSYVRSALVTVATPFRWCFTKIGEGLSGYAVYFKSINELREENARLKEELADIEDRVYDAELIEEENEYLRSYLGIKGEHGDFMFASATVIGRESTNYRTVFTLSKGSLHGVDVDMPVITEDGLVGYITAVGSTWSRAVLITETAEAVGGYIERTGVLGVVEGSYELRAEGLCQMVYIDAESDIREGDRVLSSGIGGVYPRGIPIGVVTKVESDATTRTLVATVEPLADLDSVSKVMIITEYELVSQ